MKGVLDKAVKGLRSKSDLVSTMHYEMSEQKVEEAFSGFRREKEGILITVDMAKMGFDEKNLEVLVIARPVRTPLGYVQIRGRVLRKPDEKAAEDNIKRLKDKPHAVLIDFTEASKHEDEAERVEKGEYLVEAEKARKEDLEGYGKAPLAHGSVKVGDFRVLEIGGTKESMILKEEKIKEKPILVAKEQEERTFKPQCPICHSVGTLKYVSTFKSSKLRKLEAKCTYCGQHYRVVARRTIGLQWEIVSIKPIFDESKAKSPHKWKSWKWIAYRS